MFSARTISHQSSSGFSSGAVEPKGATMAAFAQDSTGAYGWNPPEAFQVHSSLGKPSGDNQRGRDLLTNGAHRHRGALGRATAHARGGAWGQIAGKQTHPPRR